MWTVHVSADHIAGLPNNRTDLSWVVVLLLGLVWLLAWGVKPTRLCTSMYLLSTALLNDEGGSCTVVEWVEGGG